MTDDDIEPDFYASILTLEHDSDDGPLHLIVATTENTVGDSDDVVLTASLPDFDPINAANKILETLADEGIAHWKFLRTWYEDGDTLRAEMEGNPKRLRFQRVDIYFVDDEDLGESEEFRLCRYSDTEYLMFLPDSEDKFDIWYENEAWRTDFSGEENTDYDTLADLVEKVFLTT